jgi:hypothetical protein
MGVVVDGVFEVPSLRLDVEQVYVLLVLPSSLPC